MLESTEHIQEESKELRKAETNCAQNKIWMTGNTRHKDNEQARLKEAERVASHGGNAQTQNPLDFLRMYTNSKHMMITALRLTRQTSYGQSQLSRRGQSREAVSHTEYSFAGSALTLK